MKKASLSILTLCALTMAAGISTAAGAETYSQRTTTYQTTPYTTTTGYMTTQDERNYGPHHYDRMGYNDDGHKTYNLFNGDQPPGGPADPFKTHSEKVVVIDEGDRQVIHTYITERSYCPPGMSKASCAATANTRTAYYNRGDYLPETITYRPLPRSILTRLAPPTEGQYVMVDRNVYLIEPQSRQVLDSVVYVND